MIGGPSGQALVAGKRAAQYLYDPPITLIDGEALIQLLIDYDIGVKKKKLELWELDADALSVGPTDTA